MPTVKVQASLRIHPVLLESSLFTHTSTVYKKNPPQEPDPSTSKWPSMRMESSFLWRNQRLFAKCDLYDIPNFKQSTVSTANN